MFCRWKTQVLPPTPENQADVIIDNEYTKNGRGESIIVGDDPGTHENDRIITMSSPRLLKELGRAKRLNIDATFKSSPMPNWAAVLIIYGLLGGGASNVGRNQAGTSHIPVNQFPCGTMIQSGSVQPPPMYPGNPYISSGHGPQPGLSQATRHPHPPSRFRSNAPPVNPAVRDQAIELAHTSSALSGGARHF